MLLCTIQWTCFFLQICTAKRFNNFAGIHFWKFPLFFGNMVGIKKRELKFSVSNKQIEHVFSICFLLYQSFNLFFPYFYSFSLILSKKSFQSELRVRCPKVLCTLLTQKFVDSFEKNSFVNSFPLFVMATRQLIFILLQEGEGVPWKGGRVLGPRHSQRRYLTPPLPYSTEVSSLRLKGRVGPHSLTLSHSLNLYLSLTLSQTSRPKKQHWGMDRRTNVHNKKTHMLLLLLLRLLLVCIKVTRCKYEREERRRA